jgi:hypothetical protein
LLLRKYRLEDLESYHLLKSHPRVWAFSTYKTFVDLEESKKALLEVIEK